MAPALKGWIGLTVGGCALISAWTLPPSVFVRRQTHARLPEETRAAALRADVVRTRALIQRIRWMDSLPALALATAQDGIAVGGPPALVDPAMLTTIRTLLRAELSDRQEADRGVTVGYFVQSPGFAAEGAYSPDARTRQETYVGTLDGAPYCIQLLVRAAPVKPAQIHVWRGSDGERHSNLARACRLVALHGLPGPAVQAWLRAGALRFAESTTPPPPFRGDDQDRPGNRAFGRRDAFWPETDLGLERCMAGERDACADQVLTPQRGALLDDLSDARVARTLPSALGGVYDPATPPALTQTSTYLLGDLEREYGAERFGRFWRSQDDVAQAFQSAFGVPIADWTAAWVAAHLGTLTPGPALPRQASSGTVLALLLGALAAGAWHRWRVGVR
jgi:hypothetical protein